MDVKAWKWMRAPRWAVAKASALFAVLTALFACVPAAHALRPAPRLVTPAAEQPIALDRLTIRAELLGSVARTTVEMVFYNPNPRPLEGELQFPLLDGQQVTGFALDVGGELRDAVPVDKSRGQQVFEDITRRRVDPGLLQVTQGNNFKVRVYPIFPRRSRSVSVTYTETLAVHGARASYRLPLEYGATVREFSASIAVRGAALAMGIGGPGSRDLQFKRTAQGNEVRVERRDYRPRGELEVTLALAPGARVITQQLDTGHYFRAELPVSLRKVKRALPQRIGIVWDSSASAASRNLARELELLDRYFAAVRNVDVQLVRVRDVAEPAQPYYITHGNWTALRRALEQTVYDGATNLAAFVPDGSVGEYLLFSDGLANYGAGDFAKTRARVHAIAAMSSANPAWLKRVAHESGGRFIDLGAEPPVEAVQKLVFDFERIRSVRSDGAAEVAASSPYPENGIVAVTGILAAPAADLVVELELGGRPTRTIGTRIREGADPSTLAGSLWARDRVAALEADYQTNRAEIQRLGRTFGLVTRETSLIVLETLQDYLTFDIEPPAELRAAYDRSRALRPRAQTVTTAQKIERVVAMLDTKAAWWHRDFPKGAYVPTPTVNRPPAYSARPPVPQSEPADGYLTDSSGAAVRTGDGSCVRNGQWTPAVAMSECEPTLIPKPAPVAIPIHAPRPEVKPAPKPMMKAYKSAMPEQAMSSVPSAELRVQSWNLESPYRARLAEAEGSEVYRIYLDTRPAFEKIAAFYIDVADTLLAKGERILALRVLSNLAEIDLEDRQNLRSLAARLLDLGETRFAIALYQRVAVIAPNEPQSFRDLGLAYAANGETQRAADTLYEVIVRPWDARFPEIELIALADLNAVVADSAKPVDVSRIDARLLRHMPTDLRIVATWDADNTNVDLLVTDPNGQTMGPSSLVSYQGGRISRNFAGGYGPEEFSVRTAKPGTYRVMARYSHHWRQVANPGPVYAHVQVYSRFGTIEQTVRTHHVLFDRPGSMLRTLADIEIPARSED